MMSIQHIIEVSFVRMPFVLCFVSSDGRLVLIPDASLILRSQTTFQFI